MEIPSLREMPSLREILSLRFKFSNTLQTILVGTSKGIILFDIVNNDNEPKLERKYVKTIKNNTTSGTGVAIFDNMEHTNISLLVGGGENPIATPNRFVIVNSQENEDSSGIEGGGLQRCAIVLQEKIENAFILKDDMNKTIGGRIIIVTKNEIFIYTLKGEVTHSVKTANNPLGLCSVAYSSDGKVPLTIAYPGNNIGEIIIWRPMQEHQSVIKAHSNEITNLTLSSDGKQIVTSSKCYTNIHVFSTINNDNNDIQPLHKFRRNTNITGSENSKILSVCISDNKEYVSCCSENGTIHIYDTKSETDSKNEKSFWNFLKPVGNYFDSKWAMQKVSIGTKCKKMISLFDKDNNLHVVTFDGDYFFLAEKMEFKPKGLSLNTK